MEAREFIDQLLYDVHSGLRADVEGLTQEQLVHQTTPGANTIAFLLWHPTRWEDNELHRLAGQQSIWIAEGWAKRFALSEGDTGTGFSEADMRALRPDKDELLGYVERVWEQTPALVASLTAERLAEIPNPERPRMTVGRLVANLVVGHGWLHLGEIRFAKGLMGMPFAR